MIDFELKFYYLKLTLGWAIDQRLDEISNYLDEKYNLNL